MVETECKPNLLDKILELPRKNRLVLCLYIYERLEPVEIARVLEMPVKEVQSLLQEAVKKMWEAI